MARWKSHRHGSGATLDLGHGLSLMVDYESAERLPYEAAQYNVYVFGRRLKTRSMNFHEAKVRAMRVADVALAETAEKLRRVAAAEMITNPEETEA